MKQLIAILLLVSLAQAETKTWDDLRLIASGQTIRVHRSADKQKGAFIAVDETTLRLRTEGGSDLAVPRSEVTRVYAQSPSHRRRNFIIGAAVGVAVGALLYGTLGQLIRNESADETAGLLFGPIILGGGIGAAAPTGTMKLVYDAKKQKP
jgi:hypothetical protein